jgi:hypothetical protein
MNWAASTVLPEPEGPATITEKPREPPPSFSSRPLTRWTGVPGRREGLGGVSLIRFLLRLRNPGKDLETIPRDAEGVETGQVALPPDLQNPRLPHYRVSLDYLAQHDEPVGDGVDRTSSKSVAGSNANAGVRPVTRARTQASVTAMVAVLSL